MNIFPMIQPEIVDVAIDLPLFKEIDWDFKRNIPIFRNGAPSMVTGDRAILVWAWRALHTKRYRYDIYTWNYWNEIESLIGQAFTNELKQSEAIRYIRECLLINPYIVDVTNVSIEFDEDKIKIECKLLTIYGEVNLNV